MDKNVSKLCVRVRFNGVFKCIELNWDDVNADIFTQESKCFNEFKRKVSILNQIIFSVCCIQRESSKRI